MGALLSMWVLALEPSWAWLSHERLMKSPVRGGQLQRSWHSESAAASVRRWESTGLITVVFSSKPVSDSKASYRPWSVAFRFQMSGGSFSSFHVERSVYTVRLNAMHLPG
jgi:hypothetical protein